MSPEGTQSQPAAAAALEAASPQDGAPPISEECVTVVVHETAEDAQTEVTNADRPDKHASQGGGRDQQAVKETEKGPQPPAGAAPGPAGAAGSGQQAPPAGASDIEVEQQAAATEQSPAGGPSNQAAASGAAAAGTGAGTAPNGMPGLTLRSALNDLVDDIFALCVRYIIASHLEETKVSKSFRQGRHAKIAWLFLAALFTFGLQMTLVTLLWNAATTGNTPLVRPQPEKLWQQVGLAHQVLCRASHSPNITRLIVPLEKCDCSRWWPTNYLPYEKAKECLSMEPDKMAASDSCDMVALSVNASLASYGRGLFTDLREQERRSAAQKAAELEAEHYVAEKWEKQRIDPFFFMIFAYISLAIVVHTEFKQGVWLCYIAAGAVGILPSFFGCRSRNERDEGGSYDWWITGHRVLAGRIPWYYKVIALFVPLLQLLGSLAVLATGGVLYLFEQNQTDAVAIIINSVALAFILEVDNKIGHILNLREDWRFPKVSASPNTRSGRGNAKGKQSKCVWAAGWVYMSLVGALMYAEMCFLAPQSAAQMLSFSVVKFLLHHAPDSGSIWGGTGLNPQFIGNKEIPTVDWFPSSLWMKWSFGGFLDGYYGQQNYSTFAYHASPPSSSWIKGAFVVYGLCTILFVALLCARMLPSSDVWWGWALLLTQLLLALVVQLQDSTFKIWCNTVISESTKQPPSIYSAEMRKNCPRNFWWFVVVMCYLGFWIALFLVWPTASYCLKNRRKKRD